MNLGVGGNPDKRIHRDGESVSDFERLLVSGLLDGGATLVLDAGLGESEAERARQLYREARDRNLGVARIAGGRWRQDDSIPSPGPAGAVSGAGVGVRGAAAALPGLHRL